ncbi:MAG: hypothetical protein GQ564_13320 [Bacteroidales bacterium]|nr:hypothetical protein [Bacteroidales bacterium]
MKYKDMILLFVCLIIIILNAVFFKKIIPLEESRFAPVTEDRQFTLFSDFRTPKKAEMSASLYLLKH